MHKMSFNFNPKYLNVTANYVNSADSDAVFNVTADVFVTVDSLKAYLRVRLPEDKNDRLFKKDLLKTSIDIEKMLSGNVANFLVKTMVENLLKSFDFEPNFPFPPVNIAS